MSSPPDDRAPDDAPEATNLGPVMDAAVQRAERRLRVGVDRDYDLIRENFDVLHYLLQVPELIDDPDVDLVEHFLEHGRELGLSPNPDFSMNAYVQRYPGKTDPSRVRNPYLYWLRRGRAMGDIADPTPLIRRVSPVLDLEPEAVADLMGQRRRDLMDRFRTGRLGEVLARAAEIEPLIGATWTEIAHPHLIPLSRVTIADAISTIYDAHRAAEFRPAKIVFLINRIRWGGGRRMEGHIAHALAERVAPEDIVVIYTDESADKHVDRFPAGVREIDWARLAASLPEDKEQHALAMLLRSLDADAIININSRLFYNTMRSFGHALAASERLFSVLFCNEQTAMGGWAGYSLRYFYRTFEHMTGVITDSQFLADDLIARYRVPEHDQQRLHVFRAPVDPGLPAFPDPPSRPGRRPQIFWAGRWDRQKRIGLFFEIARSMPDVDFRMWGEAVLTGGQVTVVPDNVKVLGRYSRFTDLPLDEADAWLYTSGWDGVPSLLLEVAMTGVPIVGSLVGGTSEVLSEHDGWPVGPDDGADSYVTALRTVLADPPAARRTALELRERMLRDRTVEQFARHAADVLLARSEAVS